MFIEFGGKAARVRESVRHWTMVVSVAVRWTQLLIWCWAGAEVADSSTKAQTKEIDFFINPPSNVK
jgi:hypothetical protein